MTRHIRTPLVHLAWPGRAGILVKDESQCPTGTFKDRLALCLADILDRAGADERLLITTITLGNTVVSLTAAFEEVFEAEQRPQILGIFPQGFSHRTIGPDTAGHTMQGSDLLAWLDRHGTRWIEHPLGEGYISRDGAHEISRAAGLDFDCHRDITKGIGVAAYEVILEEALSQGATNVDCVIVPVGAGILFDEFVDFVERVGGRARVLGVTTLHESSIADKIYGKYSPYFTALMRDGTTTRHPEHPRHKVVSVEDEAIRRALALLPRGFQAEPSAAAAFVPLGMLDEISMSDTVLVVNTGNGVFPPRGVAQ